VPNGNTTAVYAIDSLGNRTLVAGNNGSSNNLFDRSIAGLALSSTGNIYASSPTAFIADGVPPIYRVGSGTATQIPTTAVTAPQGLAVLPNGQLLAINGSPSNPSIWSIDPTSGNSTVLSDNSGMHGSGTDFNVLRGITLGNDLIYVTDVGNSQIYSVNPMTGDRTVVSGNGVGGSTFGGLSYGIAVYPALSGVVPEPSGMVLLAVGATATLLLFARGRIRRPAG
jgi:hypothetical protein